MATKEEAGINSAEIEKVEKGLKNVPHEFQKLFGELEESSSEEPHPSIKRSSSAG